MARIALPFVIGAVGYAASRAVADRSSPGDRHFVGWMGGITTMAVALYCVAAT